MNKDRRTTPAKAEKPGVPAKPRKSRSLPNAAASMVSADAIARRAYELFLQEGQQHGADLAHWFRAEQELHAQVTHSS